MPMAMLRQLSPRPLSVTARASCLSLLPLLTLPVLPTGAARTGVNALMVIKLEPVPTKTAVVLIMAVRQKPRLAALLALKTGLVLLGLVVLIIVNLVPVLTLITAVRLLIVPP